MDSSSAHPTITPELAQAVTRLGHLRRQLKDLETEESLLRDEILGIVQDWSRNAFPLRIGTFEVRLGERRGRIDRDMAKKILEEAHVLLEVPFEPVILSSNKADELRRALVRMTMPENTRQSLVNTYQSAIDWQPALSHEALLDLYHRARLQPQDYCACFKEGKPTVITLTVR